MRMQHANKRAASAFFAFESSLFAFHRLLVVYSLRFAYSGVIPTSFRQKLMKIPRNMKSLLLAVLALSLMANLALINVTTDVDMTPPSGTEQAAALHSASAV